MAETAKSEAPSTGAGNKFISVSLESVPTDIELPYAVYLQIGGKYIVFRSAGDTITPARLNHLSEKSVTCLYISAEDWRNYVDQIEAGLEDVGVKEGSQEAAMQMRKAIYAYFRSIEERGAVEQSLLDKMMEVTNKLPTAIGQSRESAYKLLRKNSDPSMYFSNHVVNTSIYAITMGLKMQLPHGELQEIALAGSLLNVGIIGIPPEILYKPKPLNGEEFAIVKQHPKFGYDTLKLLLAPERLCQTVLQHHERFDGKGYPNGIAGKEIEKHARILSIAEVFSAMTSLRPWAAPVPAHQVIEEMGLLKGKFDPRMLNSVVA